MVKHLSKNNLLHESQHGFRTFHSCQTALTSLVDTWLTNIDTNNISGAVFVDFMKAFDTINHNLLFRKLKLYRFSEDTLQFLKSYLSDRKQSTVANNKASSFRMITHGVPQGSVIGPLLFLIYINDLPMSIEVDCELFADDTTLYAKNQDLTKLNKSLQKGLNSLKQWADLNHMVVHPSKSKAMLITTRQKRQLIKSCPLKLTYDNQTIQEEVNHKVLGVVIDHNLTWTDHLSSISKSMSTKIFQLSQIKKFLPQNAKKMFFDAYILSIINYCSTLWDSTNNRSLKIIGRAYKRAIKAVINKNTSLTKSDYKNAGMRMLTDQLKINKLSLMHKIMNKKAPSKLIDQFPMQKSKHALKVCPGRVPRTDLCAGRLPRTDLYKTSLRYTGPSTWNSLPDELRTTINYSTFRRNLCESITKTYEGSGS